jgi:outer membrane lipoprotein LolB
MTYFIKRSLLLCSLFAILLSGCSSVPHTEHQALIKESAAQRTNKLKQLQHWKVQGKIAFISADSRDSASLMWQVNETLDTQELSLTTYLGINVLQLDSKNGHHKIQVDGKTYQGTNLEALIQSLTPLALPAQALTFWLKGLPYQEHDNITYQEATLLPQALSSYYNNELWQVSYSNYQQVGDYSLAKKFTIKKDNLLIKISINEWSIF